MKEAIPEAGTEAVEATEELMVKEAKIGLKPKEEPIMRGSLTTKNERKRELLLKMGKRPQHPSAESRISLHGSGNSTTQRDPSMSVLKSLSRQRSQLPFPRRNARRIPTR